MNVFGQVTVTGGAAHALCEAGKPVAHFTFGGWFSGLTQGLGLKNVFLRIAQFRRADDERFCLGDRTGHGRHQDSEPARAAPAQSCRAPPLRAGSTEVARRTSDGATSLEEFLGVEGTAARLYFEQFAGMIKADDDEAAWANFDFSERNRRPPRDPVNALLSFAYSLLVKDVPFCHAIGLDPFVGFYHQPRFGRPALALDLMDGFRPLVADSAVLTAINTRMVTPKDFIRAGRAVTMTAGGRKGLIPRVRAADGPLVTHPLFGYRVNYRRVLEIQARLLAPVTGELAGIRASRPGRAGSGQNVAWRTRRVASGRVVRDRRDPLAGSQVLEQR